MPGEDSAERLQPVLEPVPRLALKPADAARALAISPRKLWELTARGEVPAVRHGKAVTYPVELLREYLREAAQKNGGRT